WISQLIGAGLLDQTTDDYPVLKLNQQSWQVLRKQCEVRLTRSGMATASRRSRAEEASWEGVPPELFEALRTWRRELAARKSVPPYTIFHDSTLRDISRVRPTTLEGLRSISGVGEAKLREFGTEVVEMVVQLSREHALLTDTGSHGVPASSRPNPVTDAALTAFPLFRAGKSLAEVAQLLNRAESTMR